MRVVATAGHVDHGKSTLVRALTGMEPDRWAQEQARGMTIGLGYAWTGLASGETLGFVDVPGHARFIGNMLAGLGPAPAVLFVVAADEGWRQQSAEHLAAVDALGLRHGLLAVTRADLADPAPSMAESLAVLGDSALGAVEAVAVSGVTGEGLDDLRAALDRLVRRLPEPDPVAPVRLWVDRAFTVRGSGTVVTGTLGAGTLRVGDELDLRGRRVRVRGLQSLETPYDEVAAVARVAVNLRGVEKDEVGRGDALLTPGAWRVTDVVDVRTGSPARSLPSSLVLHVGSAAVPVRVRRLGDDVVRLRLHRPLPLHVGDRAILRDPGAQVVTGAALVLDPDPPELRRRGAARDRAAVLVSAGDRPDLRAEVERRGAVRRDHLVALGVPLQPLDGVQVVRDWYVGVERWGAWTSALTEAVDAHGRDAPLDAGLPEQVAEQLLGLPDRDLLGDLVAAAGLEQAGGRVRRPGAAPAFGPGLARLEERLSDAPFAAPEQPDLEALGVTRQEVAAAVAVGRLLQLPDRVLLLPDAPVRALRLLAELPQPFTPSAARQALGTTRRVALPLLEHLDRQGRTRRLDRTLREVVR